MLKLIKIFNSSILGYWYIPENRDPGLIEIDEQTGESRHSRLCHIHHRWMHSRRWCRICCMAIY